MAYHPVTFGTLLDEIVRRATGTSIAASRPAPYRRAAGAGHVDGPPGALDSAGRARPLGADRPRWNRTTVPPAPGSYAALRQAFLRENPPMDPDFSDPAEVRAHYAAERPAIGAITDARCLGHDVRRPARTGRRRAAGRGPDPEQVTRPRTDDVETLVESGTAGPDIRFGLGYQLASPSMPGFGPGSFGHTGAGGRLGIGDPEQEVGFGYVTSLMRDIGPHGDPRWRTLIDAVRACL